MNIMNNETLSKTTKHASYKRIQCADPHIDHRRSSYFMKRVTIDSDLMKKVLIHLESRFFFFFF